MLDEVDARRLRLRMRFHRSKSLWRRAVTRAILGADKIAKQHMVGDYISMGAFYESAQEIFAAGQRGVRLRHRMDEFGIIRRERVHESIAGTCKLLQTASAIIQKIAEKQGTPLIDFPLFVSELAATSTTELGAQNALKQLMEDME